jgi:hypothetical protein
VRVPVYEEPKVATQAARAPEFNVKPADGSGLAKALEQFGQGVGSGVDAGVAIAGAYREMQYKSDVAGATSGAAKGQDVLSQTMHGGVVEEAAAQHAAGGTNNLVPTGEIDSTQGITFAPAPAPSSGAAPGGPPGFKSLLGEEAVKQSVPTYEQAMQRLATLREGLANDRQRRIFDQQMQPAVRAFKQQLEDHTSQQLHVAREASLQGLASTSLTTVANDFTNDQVAGEVTANVEKGIRALQLSTEDGDSKVAAFRQKVAETRLNQYLGEKNWRGAANLFAQVKSDLGPAAHQFEASILQQRRDAVSQDYVDQVVRDATAKNGRVDDVKVLASVEQAPELIRDEVRQRAEHQVAVAKQQWTEKVDGVFNHALAAYEQGGVVAIPASDKAWMLDPDNGSASKWHQLQGMIKADREHARGAPPSADQALAFTRFLVWMADNPEKAATMTPEQYSSEWLPQFSKHDRNIAGEAFARAHVKNQEKKLAAPEVNVLLEVGRSAGLFPAKGNDASRWDDKQGKLMYQLQDEALQRAQLYRQQTGKEIPLDEMRKWATDRLTKAKIEGTGWFGGLFEDETTLMEAERAGDDKTNLTPVWNEAQKTAAAAKLKSRGLSAEPDDVDELLRRSQGFPVLPTQRSAPKAPAPPPDALPRNLRDLR